MALRRLRLIRILSVLFLLGATRLSAQLTPKEYQLKAAFVFNFTQFVEWPTNAFPDPSSPLVIGVLGDDPFGTFLEEIVHGESVAGHHIVIQHFRRPEDVSDCQILFVGHPDQSHPAPVLSRLKEKPVLTVGDAASFAKQGGMIELVNDNGKIRLRINLDAVEASHLTMSSKLLRPAEIVSARNKG